MNRMRGLGGSQELNDKIRTAWDGYDHLAYAAAKCLKRGDRQGHAGFMAKANVYRDQARKMHQERLKSAPKEDRNGVVR